MKKLKSESSVFSDLYYTLFYRAPRGVKAEIEEKFKIRPRFPAKDDLFVFEHISLTGGQIVNSLILGHKGNPFFHIPSFQEVWETPRIARAFVPVETTKVLSSHYLHGADIKTDKKTHHFSFLRDPRRLILSHLQNEETIEIAGYDLKLFWKTIESKLSFIRNDIQHANYQLYELATQNSAKPFPYIHGKETPLFNLENLRGSKPKVILDKVQERMSGEIVFVGITELFSESLCLLWEMLGIDIISLWPPGLFSAKKASIDEAPQSIVQNIEDLCQTELEFYNIQKDRILAQLESSSNLKTISRYREANKKHDLRYLLSFDERLQLAKDVDIDGSRLESEREFSQEIVNYLAHSLQKFEINTNQK